MGGWVRIPRRLLVVAWMPVAALLLLPAISSAQSMRRVGSVEIHAWPGGERLADHLAARLARQPPLPALPPELLEGAATIHVLLAPDPLRFDSLTGGRAPEWGAGVAFPQARVVVLPGYASTRAAAHELSRILRHELAHVALHDYLHPTLPPRWFDEGYARWAAGEWGWEAGWQLRLAFALGRAPPLDSLSLDWPDSETDARVAYLLAASTIGYLVDRSGERGLRLFLERWKATGAMETALVRTYGVTLSQFEEDWREEVEKRFGWTLVFTHALVFWLLVGALLLLLHRYRRRRDRDRLERLRESEPPDSPAYWLGEDDVGREDEYRTPDSGQP